MFNRKLFADWMAAQELVRLYIERNGRGAVIPERLKQQLLKAEMAYKAEVEKQRQTAGGLTSDNDGVNS